ncbi:MAG TPA: methyltransferase domain-containing protein [Pyrinomonadaceae bacterium]|nr:methyltransferase domain-containing protein [Pyrinomonadaceae bacterium]
MPIPVHGLEEHYGVDPGVYFEHHDVEQKSSGAAHLLRQAESLIGSKGRLVDVGAGRGEILRAAKIAGWEATGIEPSTVFAEYAAKYSGLEVLRKPLEECGLDDNSIDTVILAAVLEHLYNPNEVIREIARILRPGGALFIDVPNEAGLYFRVGNLYQRLRGRDWVVNLAPTFAPFHVFGFTPKSLKALLSKHGFEVRKWYVYPGTSFVPPHGGLVGSLEQYASKLVTTLSKIGNLGTYIETWAVRM